VSDGVSRLGVAAWLRAFAAAVAEEREHLTELDAAIGDADHGSNMDRGMRAVLGKLEGLGAAGGPGAPDGPAAPPQGDGGAADVGSLLKTVGMTLVSTVGGAAGPLYGTLFLEMGKAAGRDPGAEGPAADRPAGEGRAAQGAAAEGAELALPRWAAAFAAGVEGVRARGKAELGDKTMVDALAPAAEALRAAAAAGLHLAEALRLAAAAAEQGMKATTPLVARKGRASYLGARSAGHQDPGATSSWLLLRAAAEALAGDEGEARPGAPP